MRIFINSTSRKMICKTAFFFSLILLSFSNIQAAKLLFIYGTGTNANGDSAKAVGYKTLFDSFGHTTTLIKVNQILSTQLSQYDLIIIGAGTAGAGAYDWQGDTASVSAIKKSGKGILGLSRGGAVFFGKISLWSNYGQSAGGGGSQIKVLSNSNLFLTSPNKITIPNDSLLYVYNGASLSELYLGYGVPKDVVTFALVANDLKYAPFSFEKNQYFYWGYDAVASNLTTVGSNILQDVISYILKATGVTVVNEHDGANTIPNKYGIDQNYPNPFNPSTNINYQLPANSFVTIKVYDVLGKEVANLVEGNVSAGNHNVNFDASRLTSGIYIYTISTNNFVQSKKMMLIK